MTWRRVLASSSITWRELHGILQVAMVWDGNHLFQCAVACQTNTCCAPHQCHFAHHAGRDLETRPTWPAVTQAHTCPRIVGNGAVTPFNQQRRATAQTNS